MFPEVGFNLVPVTLFIPDFFTGRADGQQALQGVNSGPSRP
jgi:hypothetical protein